jgi:hypothetical protein
MRIKNEHLEANCFRGQHVGKAFRLKPMSSAVIALWAVAKNLSRNSVATARARVDPAADFKRCCMLHGEFDGSDRGYYSR